MNEECIYIGKIVNTHGIKGELRILSNFSKKDKVFKSGMIIFIGEEKIKEEIVSYRCHKEFDMITLKNYSNINEVLKYKGKKVYVTRISLELSINDYLEEDLINLYVFENGKLLGKVEEIVYNKYNPLLFICGDKNFYLPLKGNFIKKVDIKQKRIEVENAKDLII